MAEPEPVDIKLEHYSRDWAAEGGGTATAVWFCDIADATAAEAELQYSADPYDVTKKCQSIHGDFRNGDIKSRQWVMRATYGAGSRVQAMQPDQTFEVEFETASEAFTIGEGFQFPDGTPLLEVNAVVQVATLRVVLIGKRTNLSLTTFATWAGKINSDTFQGAAAGHLYFPGAPGRLIDGSGTDRIYSCRIPIMWRERKWTEVMDKTGSWVEPHKVGDPATKLYASTTFSGLLSAGIPT